MHRRLRRAAGLLAAGPPAAGRAPRATSTSCTTTSASAPACSGWSRTAGRCSTTLHHPITVDRQLALSHTTNPWQRFTTRRWFGFLRHAGARRRGPSRPSSTVSQYSRLDIAAQMGVAPERMTVVPVGVDHTRLPALRRRDAGPGPHHGHLVERRAHEGPGAAARGGGQAAHRARRRAGGHRPAPAGRPGRPGHRAPRAARRRALRERHQRRRAGPPLRRGRGGGGALALRGFLPPGDRGHGLRGRRGGHHRGRPARGGGQRRGDRRCWSRPTTPARWPPPSPGSSTTRRCGPGSGRPAASGCQPLHLAGDGRRAPPPATRPCWTVGPCPGRRRPSPGRRARRPRAGSGLC